MPLSQRPETGLHCRDSDLYHHGSHGTQRKESYCKNKTNAHFSVVRAFRALLFSKGQAFADFCSLFGFHESQDLGRRSLAHS